MGKMVLGAAECSEGDGVGQCDEEHQLLHVPWGRDLNPEEGAAELRSAGGCRAGKRLRAPEVGVSGFTWLPGGTGEGDGVIVKGLEGLQRRLDVIPSVMGAPRFPQRVSWFRDALWRGPRGERGGQGGGRASR